MTDVSNILVVEDLHLSFGKTKVLRGVEVRVPNSGVTALIGSNGAGKTALLNAISGIYHPQAGNIRFDGREIMGMKPPEIARIGLGRTFQHLELFSRLTVAENLLVAKDAAFDGQWFAPAWFYGKAKARELKNFAEIEEIIDFFELWQYRTEIASRLPFGVQKIVGIARAMALEPKLLLLDEPASGLTRDEKEDLARFLLRISLDKKVPILWIEHDLDLILDLADLVYALELGRCIASGTPSEIRNNAAVVESYLGSSSDRESALSLSDQTI